MHYRNVSIDMYLNIKALPQRPQPPNPDYLFYPHLLIYITYRVILVYIHIVVPSPLHDSVSGGTLFQVMVLVHIGLLLLNTLQACFDLFKDTRQGLFLCEKKKGYIKIEWRMSWTIVILVLRYQLIQNQVRANPTQLTHIHIDLHSV